MLLLALSYQSPIPIAMHYPVPPLQPQMREMESTDFAVAVAAVDEVLAVVHNSFPVVVAVAHNVQGIAVGVDTDTAVDVVVAETDDTDIVDVLDKLLL